MNRTYIKETDRANAQVSYSQRTRNGFYSVTSATGETGRLDSIPETTRYVRGRNEAVKVGNLARTHRVIEAMERTERIHEKMAYPIQRFSRKQRRNLTK